MQPELDAAEGKWVVKSYLKKDGREGELTPSCAAFTTNSSEVSKTLGAAAERLEKGASSPAVRETASSVYHIVTGSGHTDIDGQTFQWKQGDTFCIPSWQKYQHFSDGAEDSYLFRIHDKPMLTSLGFYRVEGMDTESLVDE